MLRCAPLPALLVLAACGGGGGATAVPPTAVPLHLAADDLDLGPATTAAELRVRLAGDAAAGAVLLEAKIELPPALSLAPNDRLTALTPLTTLDGDLGAGSFHVVCGDARNPAAAQLATGPLFAVRLVTSKPRQAGTYTLRITGLRAATKDGAPVAVEPAPTVVSVVVR